MKIKIFDLDSYEARTIGTEKYKEIARKHNLFTKKWTYGRLKEFTYDVQYEMEKKTKKQNNFIKSLFKRIKKKRRKKR